MRGNSALALIRMLSPSLVGKILRELGGLWTARPFGLETRLRSGMVRSRMPVSKWDFSSRDWLRSDASSDPEQFKQSLVRDSKFFFKPGQRAGEVIFGERVTVAENELQIRGWRFLYYGDKEPAWSFAVTAESCTAGQVRHRPCPGRGSNLAIGQDQVRVAWKDREIAVALNHPGAESAFSERELRLKRSRFLWDVANEHRGKLNAAIPDCICVKFGVRCSPNDRR